MNKFSFSRSPAWSIAHRYKTENAVRDGVVPGPGAYMMNRSGSKGIPAWKIGTSIRDGRRDSAGPGPGAYNLMTRNVAPKLTFGSRTLQKAEEIDRNPGPGSYNPKGSAVFKASQGCSLGSRYTDSLKQLTPGPGAYNSVNNANQTQHPAARIGSSKRDTFDRDLNPGPGTYTANRPFSAGPKYGFGRFQRKTIDEVTPGPGQYECKHFLEGGNSKGVTLSSKYDGNHLLMTETPGPGQYNLSAETTLRPKTPGVRIGTANRYGKYDSSTPGPGQYNNGDYRSRKGPTIKIGSSQRGFNRGEISTPGPGSYELNASRELHGITISGSRQKKSGDQIPGPGAYNPDSNFVRDRPATAKIGNGKRQDEFRDDGPGPGHYTYVDETRGPKFAFTRELRGEKNRNYNPGPADYSIPASIPNIPNYNMSSVHSFTGGLRH